MIADNIRALCKTREITLAELERNTGIGNGVIARWGTGENGPSLFLVKRVADYFGTTVDELLADGADAGPGE